MSVLLAIAAAIFVVLILVAYLLGKCFESRKIRRMILIITVVIYLLACICYFGFIAMVIAGNVN